MSLNIAFIVKVRADKRVSGNLESNAHIRTRCSRAQTGEGGRMGRGRQKAKQTKIARKLKYLTTDTDYNQLQKELASRGSVGNQADSFEVAEEQLDAKESLGSEHSDIDPITAEKHSAKPSVDDDLDDYARWAAEAAAKATSGEMPVIKPRRKPIPIPVPAALKHRHSASVTPKTPVSKKQSEEVASATGGQTAESTTEKKTSTVKTSTTKASNASKSTSKSTAKKPAAAKKKTVAAKATKPAKATKAAEGK